MNAFNQIQINEQRKEVRNKKVCRIMYISDKANPSVCVQRVRRDRFESLQIWQMMFELDDIVQKRPSTKCIKYISANTRFTQWTES